MAGSDSHHYKKEKLKDKSFLLNYKTKIVNIKKTRDLVTIYF